jgi:uncharacterized RDD family membrane protein YckC
VTTAEDRPATAGTYPWHEATGPLSAETAARSSVLGHRAGLVTRALANVADVVVVALAVVGGYAAVAVARFLISPRHFHFPVVSWATLLLIGLAVQAVYFGITWAVVGGTYGDRLLGLRVTDGQGTRLGWTRCAVRAVLCVLFPIGLLWVLVSAENRSVQDVVLRTSVVYD